MGAPGGVPIRSWGQEWQPVACGSDSEARAARPGRGGSADETAGPAVFALDDRFGPTEARWKPESSDVCFEIIIYNWDERARGPLLTNRERPGTPHDKWPRQSRSHSVCPHRADPQHTLTHTLATTRTITRTRSHTRRNRTRAVVPHAHAHEHAHEREHVHANKHAPAHAHTHTPTHARTHERMHGRTDGRTDARAARARRFR